MLGRIGGGGLFGLDLAVECDLTQFLLICFRCLLSNT
jgi:hypothetical protein